MCRERVPDVLVAPVVLAIAVPQKKTLDYRVFYSGSLFCFKSMGGRLVDTFPP